MLLGWQERTNTTTTLLIINGIGYSQSFRSKKQMPQRLKLNAKIQINFLSRTFFLPIVYLKFAEHFMVNMNNDIKKIIFKYYPTYNLLKC